MTRRQLPAFGALAGLAVLLLGTFLPWLRSGQTTRNSYAAGGVARRLLYSDGTLGTLFRVWPLVGVLVAAAVAAYALGWRPLGLALATIVAVVAAIAAFVALSRDSAAYASVEGIGPTVTLIGAGVVVIAVACAVLWRNPR